MMAPAGFYDDPPATSRPLTAADLEGLGQGPGLGQSGRGEGWADEAQGPGLGVSSSRKSRGNEEREGDRGDMMGNDDVDVDDGNGGSGGGGASGDGGGDGGGLLVVMPLRWVQIQVLLWVMMVYPYYPMSQWDQIQRAI